MSLFDATTGATFALSGILIVLVFYFMDQFISFLFRRK